MGPPPSPGNPAGIAISVGADQAILLCDAAFAGSDTWQLLSPLASALNKIKDFDLIIADGRLSTAIRDRSGRKWRRRSASPLCLRQQDRRNQDKTIGCRRLAMMDTEIIEDDPAGAHYQ